MKNACFLIFLSILILLRNANAGPVDGVDYISESVATADKTNSGIFNPAGLGSWTAMGLHYAHSFTDSSYKGDDGAMMASQSGFFAIEWLNHSDNIFRRKYTLATGERLFKDFYMGLSYSWFGGSNRYYKGRKDWKLGLLYRPKPIVSLGFVLDRINEPRFGGLRQKRLYQPGLAFRPFGDKFTLSSDARWVEGDDVSKIMGNVRLAAGPFHGISLQSEYRSEGQWRLAASFDFDQTRISAQGRLRQERNYGGGTYSIDVGTVRYGSALAGTGRVGALSLKNDIVEEPGGPSIFGRRNRSLYKIINSLRKGATDPRINGLLVEFDGIKLNFASAQELRSALTEYRNNGKHVTAFISNGGNLDYYLASVADEIYMEPTGLLELKGLAATARFYKGTMDKLGIKADVIRTGPHKTYGDAFTETTLTEAAREQINWLLDDLYQQFVDGISGGRRILPEKVKALIDSGPYTAEGAFKAGLVDGLKHYDEIFSGNNEIKSTNLDLIRFYSVEDYNPRWSEPKKIAIVYADGAILPGGSGASLLEGKTVGSETLEKALKRIRGDSSIRAVVFRVNSPGGDVFASEQIYRQLELLKGRKPLVISMGGVAASGGYYISAPGDEIMASPGTITGSIGVVMGKVDLSGFYDKIGIRNEVIKRGTHADIRSSSRPATREEMELIDKMLWEYYGDFVNKVCSWRKLDYDSVDAIGRGRVWTGRQAMARGLIDSYGGIWEAIEEARQKAKIDPDDRLQIEILPAYSFSLFPSFRAQSLEQQLTSILQRSAEGRYYFRAPYELEIK